MANSAVLSGGRARMAWYVAILFLVGLTVWAVAGAMGTSQPTAAPPPRPSPVGHAAALGTAPAAQADRTPDAVVLNSCPKAAAACVNEELRISWLQQNGKITYGPVPVMPGTQGATDAVATPKGVFHVQYKDKHHVSSEFAEPMPNAVFFAAGGIAFHEGSLVSTSHGCVHLSPTDSAHYYQVLDRGAEVAIF